MSLSQLVTSPSLAHSVSFPQVRRKQSAKQKIATGTIVYREDDAAGTLYEVVDGTVLLYRTVGGSTRQIVEIARAGSLLGLAWQRKQMATAQAVTPVSLRAIGDNGNIEALTADRKYTEKLVEQVSRLFRSNAMIACGSALGKVAFFIMNMTEYGDLPNRHRDKPFGFRLCVTRKQIGEFLALSEETVSRSFAQLQRQGVIGIKAWRFIEILDHAELARLTHSSAGTIGN